MEEEAPEPKLYRRFQLSVDLEEDFSVFHRKAPNLYRKVLT